MSSERYARVKGLFVAARRLSPEERHGLLDQACDGDDDLRKEVDRLLLRHDRSSTFQTIQSHGLLDQVPRPGPSIAAGTRLGPYEILEPLGAGGMGEVYRALDSRLGREIAIKVLPSDASADAARLKRFEKEARAASALNHPNIVTIYEIDEIDSVRFIAMERVEGETLRELLHSAPLPMKRLLDISMQAAAGLAKAHEAGIVHRDLKPENIMVTEDGLVKILDFGLAKLTHTASDGDGISELPAESGTSPGVVVGTIAYMSPEQASGQVVGPGSDQFAFGSIMYEMATGKRPFSAATGVDTLSAILHDEPKPVSALRPDVPGPLRWIIERCHAKAPKERYDSTPDLARELASLRLHLSEVSPPSSPTHPRWQKRALGVAGLFAILGGLGWWLLSTGAPDVPIAPMEITPFTSDGGLKKLPQISPDGEKVAYMWTGPADDNWDIYVKALGPRAKPIRLTEHPADDRMPAWSPDGRLVAFRRVTEQGWSIYTVPSLGGQERKLANIGSLSRRGGRGVQGLAWSPDGEWLALTEQPSEAEPTRIVRLALATVEKQPLTFPPEGTVGDAQLALSPDARHLAFVRREHDVHPGEVWVQPLDGGPARQLTSAEFSSHSPGYFGLAWTGDGSEVVFTAVTTDRPRMFRVSVAGGAPQPVVGIGEEARFPFIRGGRMVYEQSANPLGDIWRVPGPKALPGREPENFIASSRRDACPAYSPDGRKIAFASLRTGTANIWVCDSDGSNPTQLTDLASETGMPRWSPDSRRIAFDSMAAGDSNIYVIDAEGGVPRRLTPEPSVDYNPNWSRDGRWIYFSSDRGGSRELWKIPAEVGPAAQVTRNGGFDAVESWDGQSLYYSKDFRSGVWRMPVEGGEETAIVSGPLAVKGWALGRGGIYFAEAPSLGALRRAYAIRYLEFESGKVSELFRKEGPFRHESLAVSPDEQWILRVERPERQSELMLVENFR